MYESIYVPLDQSDHSNVSAQLGLDLAKHVGATLIGSHVYAAALHDVRFKQMEFTLPDEYKDETELEKQRRIHDSLIARGLILISDSYLEQWRVRAEAVGVPWEGKHFDGKNYQKLVEDIRDAGYDLVILGALGQGAVKDSQIGSVCERVLRRTRADTWVVRDLESAQVSGERGIAVCLDGSPHSYGGLRTACELARLYDKHVDIMTVHEPDAGAVDGALRDHLELARRYARDQGVSSSATALDGVAVEAILSHIGRVRPWLLVTGRIGIDSDDSMDIGSTTERLVRHAPCNVLLSSRTFVPAPRGNARA